MWTRSSASDVEAVQKVLGEPIAVGLSDRAWRTRTQLLSVSLVAIGLVLLRLRVNPDATVFGFSLSGLSDLAVRRGLGISVAYLLVHFVWMAWESLAEWRLRLTGTRVGFVTAGTFGESNCDYPSDPRQSTLANWWRALAPQTGATQLVKTIEARLSQYDAEIRAACASGNGANVATATAPLTALQQSVTQLSSTIEATGKLLTSLRIPASLDRFENAYRHFLNSQSIRWLLFDTLLPIFVALFAIVTLLRT